MFHGDVSRRGNDSPDIGKPIRSEGFRMLTSLYQTAIGALVDVMSPKARKYAYAALAVLAFLVGIWEAAGHDWRVAVVLFITTLGVTMAHANTNPVDPQQFTPAAGGAQPTDPTPPAAE